MFASAANIGSSVHCYMAKAKELKSWERYSFANFDFWYWRPVFVFISYQQTYLVSFKHEENIFFLPFCK